METLPSAKIVGKREGFAVPNSLSDFDNKADQLVYRVTGDNGVSTDIKPINFDVKVDIRKGNSQVNNAGSNYKLITVAGTGLETWNVKDTYNSNFSNITKDRMALAVFDENNKFVGTFIGQKNSHTFGGDIIDLLTGNAKKGGSFIDISGFIDSNGNVSKFDRKVEIGIEKDSKGDFAGIKSDYQNKFNVMLESLENGKDKNVQVQSKTQNTTDKMEVAKTQANDPSVQFPKGDNIPTKVVDATSKQNQIG